MMPEDPKFSVSARDIQNVVQIENVEHLTIYQAPPPPDTKTLRTFLLPQRPEHFTNRESELKELMEKLHPGSVAALCGPGGMGKTALAVEAVYRFCDEINQRFPDGVIFHSFYRQPQADQALEQIARFFGEDLQPSLPASAQRALSRRQVLLILDGAEDADDLSKILDVVASCGVIVTSRSRQDAVSARQDLPVLDDQQSLALLQAWAKEQAAEDDAARQVIELLGGLPLALRLAGHFMNAGEQTAAEYLSWLEESGLEALNFGERKFESVPKLLKRSLEQVSKPAHAVLDLAGMLAFAPFSPEPLAAALELNAPKLVSPLGELVNYGLLLRSGERYELSHALIHTYARKHRPPAKVAVERLAVFYLRFIRGNCARGLYGHSVLNAERTHILQVLSVCVEAELFKPVNGIVGALDGYLDLQGYWLERIQALSTGLVAARELNDQQNEGSILGTLGIAYRALGQAKKAIDYHEQALDIARQIGDRRGEGYNLDNLGLSYRALGQAEKAIDYHEQALDIARETGDRRVKGNHLCNLGSAYSVLGQAEKAIDYYKQALDIFRETGDRRGEGSDLCNLGLVYYNLGQAEKAIDYYKQALDIARETGDRRGEGNNLGNLGLAYHNLGQVERAINYYEQALDIARKIGDRRNEGTWLGNLGNVYYTLGQAKKAIGYYEQALDIARQTGDRHGEGYRLDNLGLVYYNLGQVEKAIDYYEQALDIARQIGDRSNEGRWLATLGIAYRDLGQVEKAIVYYEQALDIARQTGDRHGEGSDLGNLGNAYRDLGQVEKAIVYYEQALDIARQTGDRRAEGTWLGNIGNAYYNLGQVKKAIDYHEQALDIARQIGDRSNEGRWLGTLGSAYRDLGQVKKAKEYLHQSLKILEKIKSPYAEKIRQLLQKLEKK